MPPVGLGAVEAVAPILSGEGAEAVAGDVVGGHLGKADDAAAGGADAGGQLAVLVVVPFLVPAALLLERGASPNAGETAVDLGLAARLAAERGLAGAEPAAEGERHAARPGVDAARELRPAYMGCFSEAQALDAAREVIGPIVRVGIHPCDELPARGAQADVERDGRGPLWVVQDAHALVLRGELAKLGERAVRRAAVDEEELDLALETLPKHLAGSGFDVGLLVQDRGEDAHVH